MVMLHNTTCNSFQQSYYTEYTGVLEVLNSNCQKILYQESDECEVGKSISKFSNDGRLDRWVNTQISSV